MSRQLITKPVLLGIDWKGFGYLTSILSVFFLGAIAWPGPRDPSWHAPLLIAGMATSILGMGLRYKSHLDQQREIRRAEEKADGRRYATNKPLKVDEVDASTRA